MTYPRGGSEYGGFPGLIQPPPHDPSKVASEQWMLTKLTDPADETSTPEKVADEIIQQARKDGGKQNG
jgi:hypothetical protein